MTFAGCDPEDRRGLSWGIGVASFDSVSLGLGEGPADSLSTIAPVRHLAIPTYDGSGQAVHPDVLRESDRLIMAMTPYPYSDDDFENPSILVSTDGVKFTEPRAGLNPLADMPAKDHNNDPDLHVDPATGEYELLYLETERPEAQHLVSLRSRDLVSWTRHTAIDWNLAAGAQFVVSPAVIVHDGTTSLFDVVLDPAGRRIEHNDSVDGTSWENAKPQPGIPAIPGVPSPWHIDIFKAPIGYGMLVSAVVDDDFEHQNLYLATSNDLVAWTLRREPLLAHDDPALDLTSLYRSSGIVAGDRLIIWYSHQYQD